MTTILHEAAEGRATIVPWTVERYHRAIELGLVAEDASVELLEGLIVQKDRARAGDNPMTTGDRHRVAVVRLSHAGHLFDASPCVLQTQQPISLPPVNEPEPDGAVVGGQIDDYLHRPPGAADVVSVIEIADSSLALDLGPKLRAYAAAGIPQYIVADLVHNRVLVHEAPVGESYARVTTRAPGDELRIATGGDAVVLSIDRLIP